jgi:sphinganine-1-phosphate aldolase
MRIIQYVLSLLFRLISNSRRMKICKWLARFKFFKTILVKEIYKESNTFIQKNRDKYNYISRYFQIPEEGLPISKLNDLINEYTKNVEAQINNKHFSGTMYASSVNLPLLDCSDKKESEKQLAFGESPLKEQLAFGKSTELTKLYGEIYKRCNLWNELHDEFGIVNLINLQVVACVADLFGLSLGYINGLVCNGGTESIMNSARMYMNWGCTEYGISRNKCVIIAPDTIHSSLMKASQAYGFKLILVKTDDGVVSMTDVRKILRYNQFNAVALYCSLPNYPYGTIDDIKEFAKLAKEYNVGLHIDSCIGGFVINWGKYANLNIDGITSISADTHKNGLCPKGSSVLICRKINNKNLLYYSAYTVLDWTGGLYGTISDKGSSSCIQAFASLVTLLYYGKKYYRNTGKKIIDCAYNIRNFLNKNSNVQVIGADNTNIIAFSIINQPNINNGPSYRLADLMHDKGYYLNTLANDTVHFCVTNRFVSDDNNLHNFINMLNKCINRVLDEIKNKQFIRSSGVKLYCSVDEINTFNTNTNNWKKQLQNYLFGQYVLDGVVRDHFMANNNAYIN